MSSIPKSRFENILEEKKTRKSAKHTEALLEICRYFRQNRKHSIIAVDKCPLPNNIFISKVFQRGIPDIVTRASEESEENGRYVIEYERIRSRFKNKVTQFKKEPSIKRVLILEVRMTDFDEILFYDDEAKFVWKGDK